MRRIVSKESLILIHGKLTITSESITLLREWSRFRKARKMFNRSGLSTWLKIDSMFTLIVNKMDSFLS